MIGYKDEYSDIDLMVATSLDVERTKRLVYQTLGEFNPIYIKEKQFSKDIYLLRVLLLRWIRNYEISSNFNEKSLTCPLEASLRWK